LAPLGTAEMKKKMRRRRKRVAENNLKNYSGVIKK
jgi:hypothetical protein